MKNKSKEAKLAVKRLAFKQWSNADISRLNGSAAAFWVEVLTKASQKPKILVLGDNHEKVQVGYISGTCIR